MIEQMKLSDKAAVLAFLLKAYPENPRQSDERFWNWHFPESPYCDPNDLPIWLAKPDDGRIAGQLASVPVEFNVGDETVPAIWILDIIVDPDFRRQGIAKKLALASMDFCPYVLGVNTPKQHAPKLLDPAISKDPFPGQCCPGTGPYPAGFFTEFSQSVVKRAGYIAAFSTVYGRDDNSDVFALNRSEILHRHGYPFRFARRIRSIFPG